MADIELVIKIPEEVYKDIMIHNRELRESGKSSYYLEGLIQNGTPLPKGHGRLIDADKLKPEARFIREDGVAVYVPAVPIMKVVNAPTIIEADKESEE